MNNIYIRYDNFGEGEVLMIFLLENIKDSTLEIIQAARHLSNLDQPDEFNRILQKYLEANSLFLWDLNSEI